MTELRTVDIAAYRAHREHTNKVQRAWRLRTGYNQSQKRKEQALRAQFARYGITPEAYSAMLAAQGGACAICRAREPGMKKAKRLYVDHCHATGVVRGLLCFKCNSLLANARDSVTTLQEAIKYLRRK